MEALNIKIIKITDVEYPHRLLNVKTPPKKIYVEGDYTLLSKNSIAIVGSRDCTQYGKKYAFVAGTIWFTNLDHGKRHTFLKLMSEEDIIKLNNKMIESTKDRCDNIIIKIEELKNEIMLTFLRTQNLIISSYFNTAFNKISTLEDVEKYINVLDKLVVFIQKEVAN